MSSDPSTPSRKGSARDESANYSITTHSQSQSQSQSQTRHPQSEPSQDQDSSASLSTTPTQSHLGGRIASSVSGNSWNSRDESSADGSQSGTIGRGPPPRAAVSGSARSASRLAAGVSRESSEPQSSQRAVSYAPSDLETVSGMSASEYSSGGEEDAPAASALPSSSQSGRGEGNSTIKNTANRSNASHPTAKPSSGSLAGGSGGRRSSTAGTARSSSRNRRPSLARAGLNDEDEDDRFGPLDDEDDEVEPHDRGEELVRRRMKARQMEKAKRKKKEKEQRVAAAAAAADAGRRASIATPSSPRARAGSSATARAMSPTGGPGLDREGKPNFISLPPPSLGDASALSPGQMSVGTQAQLSPSAGRGSIPSTPFYPSPHSHIRRPQQQSDASAGSTAAGLPARRMSGMSGVAGAQNQSIGGRSSAGTVQASQPQQQSGADVFSESGAPSDAGRSTAESVLDGGEEEEIDPDEERDVVGGLATEQPPIEEAAANLEEDEEGEDSGSPSGDGSEEDVEYTLKDRQDAINIEHPFGLPIWKPALYKKSRSVTRNAESALHQLPTAAAERHFLPGNLLWTLMAGAWLAVVCLLTGIILNFVPYGGDRYARVAWELGGYIFWPFGKYVEVEVDPHSGERGMSYATQDGEGEDDDEDDGCRGYQENQEQVEVTSFTPVAARYPHDHTHKIPFNSRATKREGSEASNPNANQEENDSSGSNSQGESSTAKASDSTERSSLKGKGKETLSSYGAINNEADSVHGKKDRVSDEEGVYEYVLDESGRDVGHAGRLAGKVAYGFFFWLIIAPLMGVVCLACWGAVFPIPMAKLTWVLLKNLSTRPLALHFRSALSLAEHEQVEVPDSEGADGKAKKFFKPLRPGQLAPRSKSFRLGEAGGDSSASNYRRSKILLCTYRAVGSQYYKYTVGGVNILFVNTLPIVGFTILDFFFLERYVEHHGIKTGFLAFISAQGTIFILALLSVIPLSYFIGMAVASISAQSSIGMGAVINATFGSIIEIILYAIALTQQKARLVEGSLVGSILAGVLLMPGLSMCSGATRRKEQRFNARSAGVTSTMLIMAIIGILTPTLFYQIYGTFQLTCQGCPDDGTPGQSWTCKRCFYEHVPPATDPFYQDNVKGLMYTCTVILVLSYGIGLWFSLRTHASQIWQNPNPQPSHHQQAAGTGVSGNTLLSTSNGVTSIPSAQRASIYKRLVPQNVIQQLLPTHNRPNSQASQTGHQATASSVSAPAAPSHVKGKAHASSASEVPSDNPPVLQLPEGYTQEDYARAVAMTASAFHSAMQQQNQHHQGAAHTHAHPQAQASANQAMPRGGGEAAPRHVSMHEAEDEGGHGGHDAPSWSRGTSVSVLLGCTVLYAIIAEILVDVVDVVLDGSGIDEKFLGITLFALVPNTTEFMNAMSFAINGNIALSMEIGSAYALQVCLIQIPAMVAFSAYYNATHGLIGSPIHRSFTLIFPRWDVIAIIFSVFLLTYTYIEARSNYYRGSICILSYLVLVAGFYFAPSTGDTELPEDGAGPNISSFSSFPALGGSFGASPLPPTGSEQDFSGFGGLINHPALAPTIYGLQWVGAVVGSLWTR